MAKTQILTLVTTAAVHAGQAPALPAALALAAALEGGVVAILAGTGGAGPDLAAARAALAASGCDVVVRSASEDDPADEFAGRLRAADLGVLEVRHRPAPDERRILDAALFDSGRPVLLVGGAAVVPPRRILVGWDDSPAAVRAMTAALPLIVAADEVVVATVDEGRADGGSRALDFLSRHGASATFRRVARGKGEVFADIAAVARDFDLLVCGAVRRSRAQEVLFGGVTGAILSGAVDTPAFMMA